jgi:8-oxo-dGTP pyrophosphatase MutT (NUDIX family)
MKRAAPLPPMDQPRAQFGALPYRLNPDLEILLVTSRGVGRWVIPKGWPVRGKSPRGSAAVEALEEAGVVGEVSKRPIGVYDYVKIMADGAGQDCLVTVFPLRVKARKAKWREQDQRQSDWFDWKRAAALVDEPGLADIIRDFAAALAAAPAAATMTTPVLETETAGLDPARDPEAV